MKKALISSIEVGRSPFTGEQTGYRVAQVEDAAHTFPVASALFWVDCADDVVADLFYYNPDTTEVVQFPVPAPDPEDVPQPSTNGAQNF